jgi:hypothetical protein
MGLLDKLQVELNRAGRAAQGALDEGRLRLEIFRVRQLADKAAQALGYAVYRARGKGEELEAAAWERLAATLRDHEAEAARLNEELARVREPEGESPGETPSAPPAAASAADPATSAPSDPPSNPI